MFLSEANFVSQQEVSIALFSDSVPVDEPSLHITQRREAVYFVIGQDATTIGRPTLNSPKTRARNKAEVRYLSIFSIL